MVVVKLCIVLLVIAVGVFYVDTANWDPFAPNGVTGVLKGVSAVFLLISVLMLFQQRLKNVKIHNVICQDDVGHYYLYRLYIAIALVLTEW
jgi:hypothetical protein